jgi:ligand-binding SRPBCC domain-containing protein
VAEVVLHREVWLPQPMDRVFAFFSDATNLEALTPPWMRFRILTPTPIPMFAGQLIDYRLRVRGIPIRWRTRIEVWEPPFRFVDVQVRGPYHLWHHQHSFESRDGGTLCSDVVTYRPRGGSLIQRLFVDPDVRRIFDYRSDRLRELMGQPDPVSIPA